MAFRREKIRERGGRKWYKEKGKCIIKYRIEFPDPIFMTLDTPHGPNDKFLKKKLLENAGKIREKIIFLPFWFLIQKLDHNSGLHAKKTERNLQ